MVETGMVHRAGLPNFIGAARQKFKRDLFWGKDAGRQRHQ
jgi:hypothetical protein